MIPQRVRPDSNEHTRTLAIAKRLLGTLMYPEVRESEEMSEAIRVGVPIWSYVRKRTDITADYRRVFDRLAVDLQFVRKSGDERSML